MSRRIETKLMVIHAQKKEAVLAKGQPLKIILIKT